MNQGENAPPMHARCRCTIVAYDGLQYGTRAARDFGESLKGKSADFEGGESGGKKIKTPFGEVNGTKVKIKLSDGEVVDHYRRVPADMSYRDWKAIYIDKSKSLETWQAEFALKRAADENSPLRQRGRAIIDKLAAGDLPTQAANGKISENKVLSSEQVRKIRDAEERAYQSKTDADFGFKKKSASAWSDAVMLANKENSVGRDINCQRCVVAHEARMRGYDVIARPSWGEEDPLQRVGNWLGVFDENDREIFKCKGSTPDEIEKFISDKMHEWGKGSRAFVWFEWENPLEPKNFGHVIVVQINENNFVQYGDPQRKRIGAVRYLKEVNLDKVMLMRVDNLKFTDLVKRCCMTRGDNRDG